MDFATLAVVALRVLSFVNPLIKIAEAIFGKGTGATKKAFVKTGLKSLVDNMQEISTGGQKETWERLEEPFDRIIDAGADAMFPHNNDTGAFNH